MYIGKKPLDKCFAMVQDRFCEWRVMLTEIRPRGKNDGTVISIGYAMLRSNILDVY